MKTITLQVTEEEYKTLLEKYKPENKRWRAKKGETYFCVDDENVIKKHVDVIWSYDDNRHKCGNYYKTEKLAETEVLRRESIANAWVPEEGDNCFSWNFVYNHPSVVPGGFDNHYLSDAYIGAVHKTKSECQAWGNKYSKAFKQQT